MAGEGGGVEGRADQVDLSGSVCAVCLVARKGERVDNAGVRTLDVTTYKRCLKCDGTDHCYSHQLCEQERDQLCPICSSEREIDKHPKGAGCYQWHEARQKRRLTYSQEVPMGYRGL